MIPKLFEADATSFNTLGLTALSDAETCEITEERNGIYELKMAYPVSGVGFEELQVGRLIVAKPNETSGNQAFEIYRIDKPMNGLCTIKAEHISYRLKRIICSASTGYSRYAWKMMSYIHNWALGDPVPFTFESDIGTEESTVMTLTVTEPTNIRSILQGMKGSILSLFGGEFEWDNWRVILHSARGSDNGVRIKYGKNLTGLKVTTDISEVYTGIDAYYVDSETGTVTESGLVTISDNPFVYQRVKAVNASSDFQSNAPTQADLITYAQSYLARNNAGQIDATVDASFYPLWQMEEYRDLNDLERVSLCDTVTIDYEKLNVLVKAKVIKTVYDCLRERYVSVGIGKPKIKIADAIKGVTNAN